MSFFGDFRKAMDTYASDHMSLTFYDFELIEAGTVLNTDEWFRCHLQVSNNGELNLQDVRVSVDATSYARIQTEKYPETYTQMILPLGDMPAHSSKYSGWIYGLATAETSGPQDVITAKINRWNADLTHLLNAHNLPGPPQGRVSVQIFPD